MAKEKDRAKNVELSAAVHRSTANDSDDQPTV